MNLRGIANGLLLALPLWLGGCWLACRPASHPAPPRLEAPALEDPEQLPPPVQATRRA